MTKALISCLVLNTPDQLGRCLIQQGIFKFTKFECQLCFAYISNSSQLTLKLNFLYIKKDLLFIALIFLLDTKLCKSYLRYSSFHQPIPLYLPLNFGTLQMYC